MSAFISPIPASCLRNKISLSSTCSYFGIQFARGAIRSAYLSSRTRSLDNPIQAVHMEMQEGSVEGEAPVAEDTKLFVGNLSWNTTDASLSDAFTRCGNVVDSRVIFDKYTGKSRGFGFIEYETAESAADALESMNGAEVDGRSIRVDRATRRAPRPRSQDNYF